MIEGRILLKGNDPGGGDILCSKGRVIATHEIGLVEANLDGAVGKIKKENDRGEGGGAAAGKNPAQGLGKSRSRFPPIHRRSEMLAHSGAELVDTVSR